MKLQTSGKNIELTPALTNYVESKFNQLNKLHFKINHINIILQIEKNLHVAEATLHNNGKDLHARAESADMYQSIDLLVEKLIAQLKKHKEKIIQQHQDD